MKYLPPLTKMMDKGPEGGYEFERLMKALLVHDSLLRGYVFEPGPTIADKGIDGIVRKKYPGMNCPVIFQFKWLEGPINRGNVAYQIKNSFECLSRSGVEFNSYVLVTPNDLNATEKKWLENLPSQFKVKCEIYHYGNTIIQTLLDAYPALKKYYYGEYVDTLSQNFKVIKEKYRRSIIEEVKHLDFISLPTSSYQKQHLLEKPELEKIYIPLDFTAEIDSSQTATLNKILNESNRVVVLGDPGSGKSTLVNYLALSHLQEQGDEKKLKTEGRIPLIISIREFVQLQQEKKFQAFNFIKYLKHISVANYEFNNMDEDFFISMLEMGKAIALFDGLHEVASERERTQISKKIQQFSLQYPDSPVWVTSRIMEYTVNVKLDSKVFDHYYLTPVTPKQADRFIKRWYEIQIPKNKTLKEDRIHSLQEAIEKDPGVQRLKTNPLLLTTMTLVHQFEGTFPDNHTKLYEKLEKENIGEIISFTDLPLSFISFEGNDRPAAKRLASHLKNDGINVWLDERNINPGNEVDESIIKSINKSTVFIPLISKNSEKILTEDGKLKYHIREWERAYTNMVSDSKEVKIIPVKIDNTDWLYDKFNHLFHVNVPGGHRNGDYEKLKEELLKNQKSIR